MTNNIKHKQGSESQDKSGIRIGAIILLIFFLMIAGSIGYKLYKDYKKHQEWSAYNVRVLYKYQNKAFGMDKYDKYYLGQSHMSVKTCHIYLLAYKIKHPEAEISVNDILNYLGDSEYDKKGKLKITKKPQNIEDYIEWFNVDGGDEFAQSYKDALTVFYKAHTGKKFSDIRDNDIETLNNIASDLHNCPTKERYMALTKEQREEFVDKETSLLVKNFLDGKETVTYAPSTTFENHNSTLVYFEDGKEYSYNDIIDNITNYLATTIYEWTINTDNPYDDSGYRLWP